MTKNAKLKKAIKSDKQISGVSYTEQRRETILNHADEKYGFSLGIPNNLFEVFEEISENTDTDYISPDVYDTSVSRMGIGALFPDSDEITGKYGTWNSALVNLSAKAYDGNTVDYTDATIMPEIAEAYARGENLELALAIKRAGIRLLTLKYPSTPVDAFVNENIGSLSFGSVGVSEKYSGLIKERLDHNETVALLSSLELSTRMYVYSGRAKGFEEFTLGGYELLNLLRVTQWLLKVDLKMHLPEHLRK